MRVAVLVAGVVVLVLAQVFVLGALWVWAAHGMTRSTSVAVMVTWIAATATGAFGAWIGADL